MTHERAVYWPAPVVCLAPLRRASKSRSGETRWLPFETWTHGLFTRTSPEQSPFAVSPAWGVWDAHTFLFCAHQWPVLASSPSHALESVIFFNVECKVEKTRCSHSEILFVYVDEKPGVNWTLCCPFNTSLEGFQKDKSLLLSWFSFPFGLSFHQFPE